MNAEVFVVDNGSTDSSKEIVSSYKSNFKELILIGEDKRGYGFGYLRGLKEVSGDYIFMADADGTYNFSQILL